MSIRQSGTPLAAEAGTLPWLRSIRGCALRAVHNTAQPGLPAQTAVHCRPEQLAIVPAPAHSPYALPMLARCLRCRAEFVERVLDSSAVCLAAAIPDHFQLRSIVRGRARRTFAVADRVPWRLEIGRLRRL